MYPIIQTLPAWAQVALLIVPSISAIFAAIGLALSASQVRRTNKQARATIVSDALKAFSTSVEMKRAFYMIEYSRFTYDESFHDSDLERELDQLLQHFSIVALSWQSGLLKAPDLKPLEYFVLRIMRDSEVKMYVAFVESWSQQAELGQHPYSALAEMGRILGA